MTEKQRALNLVDDICKYAPPAVLDSVDGDRTLAAILCAEAYFGMRRTVGNLPSLRFKPVCYAMAQLYKENRTPLYISKMFDACCVTDVVDVLSILGLPFLDKTHDDLNLSDIMELSKDWVDKDLATADPDDVEELEYWQVDILTKYGSNLPVIKLSDSYLHYGDFAAVKSLEESGQEDDIDALAGFDVTGMIDSAKGFEDQLADQLYNEFMSGRSTEYLLAVYYLSYKQLMDLLKKRGIDLPVSVYENNMNVQDYIMNNRNIDLNPVMVTSKPGEDELRFLYFEYDEGMTYKELAAVSGRTEEQIHYIFKMRGANYGTKGRR